MHYLEDLFSQVAQQAKQLDQIFFSTTVYSKTSETIITSQGPLIGPFSILAKITRAPDLRNISTTVMVLIFSKSVATITNTALIFSTFLQIDLSRLIFHRVWYLLYFFLTIFH